MEKEPEESQVPTPSVFNDSRFPPFKRGFEEGRRFELDLHKSSLHFRTFASAWMSIWLVGAAVSYLGATIWALIAGCLGTVFVFYVLDQTELAIKQWLKNRKEKKEKKDGDSTGSDSNLS